MIDFKQFEPFKDQLKVGKRIVQTPFGEIYEGTYTQRGTVKTGLIHVTLFSAENAESDVDVRIKRVVHPAADLRSNDKSIMNAEDDILLPVIASEYYPNKSGTSVLVVTLYERADSLENAAKFNQDEAFEICLQLCRGMAELHARGVAHGAICPSTVFIQEKSVRLICLGYASVLRGQYAVDDNAYLNIADKIDTFSDVYSVGMICRTLMACGKCVSNPRSLSLPEVVGSHHLPAIIAGKSTSDIEVRSLTMRELESIIFDVRHEMKEEALKENEKRIELTAEKAEEKDEKVSVDMPTGADDNYVEQTSRDTEQERSKRNVLDENKSDDAGSGKSGNYNREDQNRHSEHSNKGKASPIITAVIALIAVAAVVLFTPIKDYAVKLVNQWGEHSASAPINTVLPDPTAVQTEETVFATQTEVAATANPTPVVLITEEPTLEPIPEVLITEEPTSEPTSEPDPVAVFNDKAFMKKLQAAANLSGTIHMSDLLKIKTLTLNECGLSDISDIAMLKNLEVFYALHNSISDISALAQLSNLTEVHLRDNKIQDISALAGLTRLNFVGLSDNRISDLSPLENLTNVTELHLHDNNISDISALANLTKLVKLSLYNNSIQSLLPLSAMTKMKDLQANANRITSAAGLENLTMLETLKLHENAITDISALRKMTHLKVLCLGTNHINDLNPLSSLYDLEELHLKRNDIHDVSALAELTKLRYLALYENHITDASPLYGLTKLETLKLQGNNIPDEQKSYLKTLMPHCNIIF